jgi:hypothetical protein
MYVDGIQLERCCVDGASTLISRKLFFTHRSFRSLAEASEYHVMTSPIKNHGVRSLDIEIFATSTSICFVFIRQIRFWALNQVLALIKFTNDMHFFTIYCIRPTSKTPTRFFTPSWPPPSTMPGLDVPVVWNMEKMGGGVGMLESINLWIL